MKHRSGAAAGALLSQMMATPRTGPPLPELLRLAPSAGNVMYIFFALQWGTGGKPDSDLVVASLKAMDPYLLASLHATGTLCFADDRGCPAPLHRTATLCLVDNQVCLTGPVPPPSPPPSRLQID